MLRIISPDILCLLKVFKRKIRNLINICFQELKQESIAMHEVVVRSENGKKSEGNDLRKIYDQFTTSGGIDIHETKKIYA